MIAWTERTREEAFLFNPPFCALLLAKSLDGFTLATNQGMPYAMSFLVLPLILHKKTREELPNTIKTSLPVWLQNKGSICAQFPGRAKVLSPMIKDGLIFGINSNLIYLSDEGLLFSLTDATKKLINRYAKSSTPEVKECIKKAEFVGRWLAKSGTIETLFALLGVKP